MAITLNTLVDVLCEHRFLPADHLADLLRHLAQRCRDARGLAKELIRRDWLTVFQINHLFGGRPDDLVVGPYRILDRLGTGGAGTVYKARHVQQDRLVALKMLRCGLDPDPNAVPQFEREIEALRRLTHRHIIRLLDAGEAGGRRYFAMEHLEGTDLGKRVRLSGALPVAAACEYVRQAALGLHGAYQGGLVHRDVKPANLFLAEKPGPETGFIKIIDWGLACERCPQAVDNLGPAEVPQGAILGTADYLAPEQIRNPGAVDNRADVYSLGCTFFHLLTGRPPFPGGSLVQKLFQHEQVEPPPVSALRPEVPAELDAVVQKMLAKRPAERYQTPEAVTVPLERFCRPGTTSAAASSP
jgi:serine/threonine protein kinase